MDSFTLSMTPDTNPQKNAARSIAFTAFIFSPPFLLLILVYHNALYDFVKMIFCQMVETLPTICYNEQKE